MNSNITISGVTFTPDDIDQIAEAVTAVLQTTAKDPSQYEVAETLEGTTTLPVFKQSGNTFTLVRVLTSLLKGADGKQIELRATKTHLQWRLLDAPDWINLLPVSTLVQEATELYGGDIEQLRGLKFDGVEKTDEGLVFYANGEIVAGPIEVGSGSGSGGGTGGGGSVIRVQNLGSSSVGTAAGQTVVIHYNFTSSDAETEEPTGDGTAAYYVNSIRVATRNIHQGENTFDVTPYLAEGINTVRIQVTDSYGAIRQLNIGVTVVNISLTSTFNSDIPWSSAVTFPFTPVGSGTKTVHFILDGQELAPLTTTATNRQLTYALPPMTHGAHLLRVYATMSVEGIDLASDTLVYSIIYVEDGNSNVIVSSRFVQTEASQFDNIVIPFVVYDPQSSTAQVDLRVNGETVSELTVNRTLQNWAHRVNEPGEVTLEIASGTASLTFTLQVAPSSISSEAETEGLQLYLTSAGRSNSQNNRDEWKYDLIQAAMTGFNFTTNGWVLDDDGVSVLRVSAGSQVIIPFKLFQTDFKQAGKTIEFEFAVHDVEDFGVPVIRCWSGARGFRITPNEVRFASQLSSLAAKFKEDEVLRVSIVIHSVFDKRLILLYLNGVASGAVQYSASDNFAQSTPEDILIGHEQAIVDLYNIRVYNTALGSLQILNNYIADTADTAKKLTVFERNQICDASGEIEYASLLQQLPCMTVTGILPAFKGDKKTVKIAFENNAYPEKSFTSENVQIDVQGTSSQFYPRKNYKTKHNSGFDMTESGVNASKYVLQTGDIEAKVFCEKTDFAESSGTHNTGLARFINDLLVSQDIKTPPQRDNAAVRTTVDGYPVAMFHRATENDPRIFIGKYNFNHDKDAQEVFGLTGDAECWEFLNNTSDLCLFKSDDFSGDWTSDLGARYPDGYEDNTNLQILWTWITDCIGNPEKFKSELEQHFNKKNILSYCLITELFGMVDQRAKNMFATSWGNEGDGEYKWYFIFYDNDTCNGINNEGTIAFGYNIETADPLGSGHVWNGWNSELWKLVEQCFADEMKAMYHDFRTSGALSYDAVARMLNEEQCARWCEVIYNMDGQYKYIQPMIDEGNATYLYALQGSRIEHRKWWLRNRFFYLDGKYNTGDFLSDFITMRLYTPSTWEGIEPDANFPVELFKDGYVRVKYGSYLLGQRAQAGQPLLIEAPDIQFNDTETIIYGVSSIKSIGSLAAKYAGTVDISQAKKLTELIIGSPVEGYQNHNLTHISIGNNTLLKVIDIRNCPNLTEPLDASGCINIREIYAEGTAISMAVLPAAGILDTLHLPATVTNLTIRNQAMLTADGLVLAGIDHIETLVLENMNSIDQPALIRSLLARSLTYVRLTGLDVADNNLNMFYSLAQLQGVDENGMNTAHAVVTGKVSVPVAYQSQIDELEAAFPELEINAAQVLADPVTTFVFASTKKDEPLTDTFFVCNRAFVKIDDVTFRVSAPPGFEIIMSFSAAEHHTTVRRHIVSITMTQNYTIQYLPDRIFIFKQYSDNSLMEGVVAVINGQTYTSDADGKITVRSIEALAGVATSAYGMANISQPSSLTAQTYNTTVYPYVNVTLYALDGLMYAPVRGIEFDIAGSLIPVDPYGFASMRLSQGAYPYTARFKGQIIKEDVLNVGTSDLALSVNNFVALEDADYFPPEDGSISFHMNPGSTLRIISDDDAYVIDWGDGTTTSATASGQVDYTHSYGIGTIRLVRILYCEGVTYARPTTTHNLLSCLSVGESGIRFDSSPLNNCSNLRLVAKDLLKNSRGKPALFFNGLFQNDSSLKSVPEGLFDGLDINNVSSLFYGCNQLESVPEHLFKDSDNITSAISVFQNCSSLTSIPSNLFSETCKPRITFFNSFFQSCGISHIVESDLTGFNLNSNNMSTSLFDNCPNLLDAVIPPNMTYIANRCFYNTSFNWIEFKSPVPPTLASTTNFDRNYPIYVPDDAVDAYRAAANWVNFASRILPVSQRPAN